MPSCPKNYPFYNWVPKPLGILILLLLFIPILTASGVYTVNSGEMLSGLGIQSEHIQFVGFLTSVGMAAFSPFFYELVCIRREKMMCIVGFSLLYILSYVCAKTDSIYLLAVCSVVMGFLRMVLMMVAMRAATSASERQKISLASTMSAMLLSSRSQMANSSPAVA